MNEHKLDALHSACYGNKSNSALSLHLLPAIPCRRDLFGHRSERNGFYDQSQLHPELALAEHELAPQKET